MTNSNNLDALFADAELPFGHPGRNFDDSPAGYSDFHDRYEPPPIDPPEEEIIHYGPGDSPLCDNDCANAVYTDDPNQAHGCEDCLELVAQDLADENEYRGRCLHCRREITAQGGVQLSRVVRRPCPHCGRLGW